MDATAHTADFLREELHVSDQFDNPEYVSITFYIKDNLNTMNRLRTEGLSQTMARLQSNIQKKESSKTKTKKKVISSSNQTSSDDKEKTATLLDSVSGLAFPFDGLTNDDWSSSMVVCIGRHRFSVVVRPPSLVSLAVFPRKHMMASTPIVPSASCICSDSVEYAWYVETSPQAYRCVSTDMFYFPCADDLGRSFKVFATPIRLEHNVKIKGRAVVLYLNGPMQHANECSMKHIRSAFNESSSASPDELRVVSFNILADAYATSDFAKDVIYKYVHETYLESEYRAVLVLDELIAYNADMLCLQECDRKSYELYFEPYLRHKGYASQFTCKVGSVVEGCAGFIRKSKLIVLACVEILLRDVLTEDPLLAQLFDARQDVREIISGCLGQVAQIWVCQSAGDGSRLVLVSNTHLFYQPSAAYVRLLQTYAITSTIQRIKTSILTEHCIPANLPGTRLFQEAGCAATPVVASNPTVSVVFAGDLNSTPETAVIEFLDKYVRTR